MMRGAAIACCLVAATWLAPGASLAQWGPRAGAQGGWSRFSGQNRFQQQQSSRTLAGRNNNALNRGRVVGALPRNANALGRGATRVGLGRNGLGRNGAQGMDGRRGGRISTARTAANRPNGARGLAATSTARQAAVEAEEHSFDDRDDALGGSHESFSGAEAGADAFDAPEGDHLDLGDAEALERQTVDDASAPRSHGVFDGGRPHAVAVVQEAWQRVRASDPTVTVRPGRSDGSTVYRVPLNRDIGFIGGARGAMQGNPRSNVVELVVRRGRLVTAYPVAARRGVLSTGSWRAGIQTRQALVPAPRPGIPRGATAAIVSQRRGAEVYTVRESSGRTQRFAFAPPRTDPAPLHVETEHGNMDVRVVAFDIDGTLVDTRQTIADGIRAGLESIGAPVDEAFVTEQTRGKPYSEVGHTAVEQFHSVLAAREPGGELSAARVAQLQETFVARAREVTERSEQAGNARAYPGAQALLAELRQRGVRVVAVTSRPTDSALALLRQAGLARHFEVVVGRQERSVNASPVVAIRGQIVPGRVMDAKPAPSSLLFALRLLGRGAHPSQTAFVGDMHTDLRSADGAGAIPIAISHGMDTAETLRGEHPMAIVADVAGLRATLGLNGRPSEITAPPSSGNTASAP